MGMKFLISMTLICLTLFAFATINIIGGEKIEEEIGEVYLGPVPEGYNEAYFRETGETISLGEKNESL